MVAWTEEELRATVRAYLSMLTAQESGAAYSKTAVRRKLQNEMLNARTNPSIEFRMRNISAVLSDHKRPFLSGYLPAANVGNTNRQVLWQFIQEEQAGISKTNFYTETKPRPPIIYFNIGWMEGYAGALATDETKGAHGYLKAHPHGAEAFNFEPTSDGTLRGYRPPGPRQQTNIAKLGASPKADFIDGVLVVWLAREPASDRTLIVGWYRNATVFRAARESGRIVNGESVSFTAEAALADATLVPPLLRTFQVRSARTAPGAGFGQSPTWYGVGDINGNVWTYVQAYDLKLRDPRLYAAKLTRKPPRNTDPELRRKVERNAIAHAIAFYQALYGPGCEVRSVELEARGWDLEVKIGSETLLVEVKGLTGAALICELTPNEYTRMMMPEYRARYVVYIVNNALAEAPGVPVASVFKYAGGRRWITEDGRTLKIAPRTGAVLSCS